MQLITLQNFNIQTCFSQFLCFSFELGWLVSWMFVFCNHMLALWEMPVLNTGSLWPSPALKHEPRNYSNLTFSSVLNFRVSYARCCLRCCRIVIPCTAHKVCQVLKFLFPDQIWDILHHYVWLSSERFGYKPCYRPCDL